MPADVASLHAYAVAFSSTSREALTEAKNEPGVKGTVRVTRSLKPLGFSLALRSPSYPGAHRTARAGSDAQDQVHWRASSRASRRGLSHGAHSSMSTGAGEKECRPTAQSRSVAGRSLEAITRSRSTSSFTNGDLSLSTAPSSPLRVRSRNIVATNIRACAADRTYPSEVHVDGAA